MLDGSDKPADDLAEQLVFGLIQFGVRSGLVWYTWLREVWLEILSPLPAFKSLLICPTDKVRLC